MVLMLSIILSAGGLFYAVKVTGKADDAGRGGALGDVAALGVLFLGRGYGSRLYEVLTAGSDEKEVLAEEYGLSDSERVDLLFASMKLEAQETRWQNRYLAATTFIGTLTWGFGDKIASMFLVARPCG